MHPSSREHALRLDSQDILRSFRGRFVIREKDLVYLDGNSLGRLPQGVAERVRQAVQQEWGSELIRAWNRGWWEAPQRVAESLGPLLGAAAGQVLLSDQTSLNLFKLATSALRLRPDRSRIVTDTLNFPSDLYVLQGIVDLLGRKHEIVRVGSGDGGITPDLEALQVAVDEHTALLALSHVAFKSGYLYDMQAITEHAHRMGALVLWDLSHSAGVVPIELDACNVDFAIGCTYKYLNGGPGSPAFLYVSRRLQSDATSPIWGWWGDSHPFAFELDYRPGAGVQRFLTGTAPMLSVLALESALAPVLEASIERIRRKSVELTEYAIGLSEVKLSPLGFALGSPRAADQRGSHLSLRHPEGYRINRALIQEMNVIPDFREPDNLRLGFAPLYVSFADVWEGIDRLRRVVHEARFEKYPRDRMGVT